MVSKMLGYILLYLRIHLFTENQKVSTAAATLKLNPGNQIEETEVRAVANLIAASVEGLQPENVTIVSTDGSVLSDLNWQEK